MKKKQKTGRKLLSFLLTLAMLVGLMPGMSLTVYAIYDPNGLEHFIPFLDNGGNVAFYDVSIRVNDDNQNTQRTVRLLFSTLTKEQITAKPGWSNISSTNTYDNCYLSGDTNTPPNGSQITVSDVGIDTQDITYTTPSTSGVNALNFEFSTVPLDPNTSYYVYFILRSAKQPYYTVYRMIGDSLGTLKPMKINYNKQKTDGTYDTTIVNTHYISGQYLDVSKLGTVPTGYHINTSSSTSSGDWNGTSEINIYYDMDVDISLTPDSTTLNVGGTQALTAAIVPSNAADKTVKWSVFGTNADAVELYSNEACTTKVGTGATETLTVYAKGISVGSATVKVTSNADTTKSATCTVTVNKANAIPATVTANNCTYDGTEKPLVTVDNSTLVGGTIYYAVTTENAAPTDDNLYTTSIPTATNAGTYYVWYKVVGDENHTDTEPMSLKVTIADKGDTEIKTEVKKDDKSPEIKTSNLTDEFAESTLSNEEKAYIEEAINNGEDVKVDVYLEIEDISDAISASDKEKIEASATNADNIAFFDISLFKEISISGQSRGATSIHNLITPLKLTIGVPKSFPAVADGYTRTYAVLRLHDGSVTVLPTTLNADGTLSFETDKFSTYALAYTDVKKEETKEPTADTPTTTVDTPTTKVDTPTVNADTPKAEAKNTDNKISTGDKMNIGIIIMLMVDSAMAALYLTLRKKMIK